MTEWWQVVLTAVASSGIVGTIITIAVKHQMDHMYEAQNRRETLRDENMFLLMERVDNSAEMTHMMAQKLHDAGVINGGLKELDEKNKSLNEKYNRNIKQLAMEVLNS